MLVFPISQAQFVEWNRRVEGTIIDQDKCEIELGLFSPADIACDRRGGLAENALLPSQQDCPRALVVLHRLRQFPMPVHADLKGFAQFLVGTGKPCWVGKARL